MIYQLCLCTDMDPLSVSDTVRLIVGLIVMIMNIVAVLVLLRCHKMKFQIRIFTIQLAVADLLFGLSIVLVGLRFSFLSPVTCRMNFHFSLLLHFVSFLTITCMSGDRCLAVCMPFKYHRIASVTRVKFLAVSLWVSSVSMSLIFLALMKPDILESLECDYIEHLGKTGFRFIAIIYTAVIVVNMSFFVGIVWALFLRKNTTGPLNNNAREIHMKEQKRILLKILGILVLFLATVGPGIVMAIVIGIEYNRKKYETPFFATGMLGICNSFLSPVIYVWRYPECRYMLLIYCNFWNQEKQDRLRGEMNRYMASYNMTSGETANAENVITSRNSNNTASGYEYTMN